MTDGIYLLDKPVGMSSFDLVRQLRRAYRAHGMSIPKIGYAGTLDPLASGLMVVGVGKGTKQLTELTKYDKEYITEIFLGRGTTTQDREGEVMAEKEVAEMVSLETISATLASLHGELMLPVSGFSAIKIDGVPMYKRARASVARGEEVPEVPERRMVVHTSELLTSTDISEDGKKFQVVTARFFVGSGTYIRSLAVELGKRLGDYPAHLRSLRRTKVGSYDLSDAMSIDEVITAKQQ